MGVGGISDYSSLFYNYRVPEIPSVDPEQLKKAEAVLGLEQTVQDENVRVQELSPGIDLSIEEKQPAVPKAVDINEISLTFNAGEDYGYIGRDSDIASLDMQKAISDMQKDQVLQQYQYFVGNAKNLFPKNNGEDGSVFLKF